MNPAAVFGGVLVGFLVFTWCLRVRAERAREAAAARFGRGGWF